jgi:hypothetical protein
LIWYCTSESEPGSDMAGVNFACDDCDRLQNLTTNVCVEPPFISGFHNTVADVDWQKTTTTVGLVGCSIKYVYYLINNSVRYSYVYECCCNVLEMIMNNWNISYSQVGMLWL